MWGHEILYADIASKDELFLWKAKNTNVEGGWKLKFVLFYLDNSWTVSLSQVKFGPAKDHDLPTSWIWSIVLFNEALNCGDGAKFWSHVVTNAEPLCADFI
jgi:hypothetical protein